MAPYLIKSIPLFTCLRLNSNVKYVNAQCVQAVHFVNIESSQLRGMDSGKYSIKQPYLCTTSFRIQKPNRNRLRRRWGSRRQFCLGAILKNWRVKRFGTAVFIFQGSWILEIECLLQCKRTTQPVIRTDATVTARRGGILYFFGKIWKRIFGNHRRRNC